MNGSRQNILYTFSFMPSKLHVVPLYITVMIEAIEWQKAAVKFLWNMNQ